VLLEDDQVSNMTGCSSALEESLLSPLKGARCPQYLQFHKVGRRQEDKEDRPRQTEGGGVRRGLIGLKAAEGLNDLGLEVTMVARRRILAAALDEVSEECSKNGYGQRHHAQNRPHGEGSALRWKRRRL